MTHTQEQTIKDAVRQKYGDLAQQHLSGGEEAAAGDCGPAPLDACGCGPGSPAEATLLADALYDPDALTGLPETVTGASLGCGNPTAIAGLRPGETVLDLGSGGGIDCFLAARAVGPAGRVIGVDMTDSMLALANQNKERLGLQNVEFRKGEIENLPVEDDSVDIVISNCVINLSPDKDAVFREAFRVLKPGGRFAVSDVVTQGDIPEPLRRNINAWVGCTVGALEEGEYLRKLRQAGFVDVAIESRASYGIENPEFLDEETRRTLTDGVDWNTLPPDARIFSAHIVARKPKSA